MINVGSKNGIKVRAIEEILIDYDDIFPNPEVKAIEVISEVPKQPKTLGETIRGAKNRAKNAKREASNRAPYIPTIPHFSPISFIFFYSKNNLLRS